MANVMTLTLALLWFLLSARELQAPAGARLVQEEQHENERS
jgi:hypothetical protein